MVVALRADHLADLSSHPDFARLLERGLHLVGGLGEEGLAQAIEGPARQVGLSVEHGLVDLLVHEVKDDPGALPLLSHVLLETWRRREGNTLTVDGYRASGGIHGAVAQSAERLYAQVEVGQRHTLRDLVLRLVTPGPRGEPVRIRVPRRIVATDPERDAAGRDARRPPGSSPVTTGSSRSPTRRSPGRGLACAAGWTTTSRASGCCTTSRPLPTPGTPWGARTASSTAGCGWPASTTGRSGARRA